MNIDDIFIKNLPKIDLHGFDRDSARVAVNDFVDEAVLMGYGRVVIVHGIGEGIVKKAVHCALACRKEVVEYYVYERNVGCTIVCIR